MADETNNTNTHFSSLESKIEGRISAPTEPEVGQFYYDTSANRMYIYNGAGWRYASFTTTTSTSTSTSTTSTSTSSTSTSSSTTTTISTTTSTSTSTTTTF